MRILRSRHARHGVCNARNSKHFSVTLSSSQELSWPCLPNSYRTIHLNQRLLFHSFSPCRAEAFRQSRKPGRPTVTGLWHSAMLLTSKSPRENRTICVSCHSRDSSAWYEARNPLGAGKTAWWFGYCLNIEVESEALHNAGMDWTRTGQHTRGSQNVTERNNVGVANEPRRRMRAHTHTHIFLEH